MGKLLVPPLAAFFFFCLLLTQPGSPAQAQPASGQPLYIAMGDSLAFGVGVTDPAGEGYVALAHQALLGSDRYRSRGLQLVNLAVPGATSSDLLQPGGQLDAALREIKARSDSDGPEDDAEIISLNIGGNDLLTLATRDSPCLKDPGGDPCQQRLRSVLSTLQQSLQQALSRLREAAPSAGIYVLGLYNPYSGTGDTREGIAEAGVQQINGVIGAVVADEQLKVKMGEVFELFRGRGKQWIAADGIHPNEKGHRVLAEVLLASIDGRQPSIPQEFLSETPAVEADPSGAAKLIQSGGDSGPSRVLLLAIAVPLAFAAGAIMSGAYFMARGRR